MYCEHCGHAMELKHGGMYDRDTGEPIMKYKCMYKLCPMSEFIPELMAIAGIILLVGLVTYFIVWT